MNYRRCCCYSRTYLSVLSEVPGRKRSGNAGWCDIKYRLADISAAGTDWNYCYADHGLGLCCVIFNCNFLSRTVFWKNMELYQSVFTGNRMHLCNRKALCEYSEAACRRGAFCSGSN